MKRMGWAGAAVAALTGMAGLTGCGSNSSTSSSSTTTTTPTTPPVTTSGATAIYVIQNPAVLGTASGHILQIATSLGGNVQPVTGQSAPVGTSFNSVAVDAANNVYAATVTPTGGDVVEYASGSTGAGLPLRDLVGSGVTQISAVDGVAVSSAGEIFVSEDTGGVAAFSATANGNTAPARYILGAAQTGGGLSTLTIANAIAADSGDNLYVVNLGNASGMPIAVFGPTATGNVAPIRTIGGNLTGLGVGLIGGIATDAAGNLWVTTNPSGSSSAPAILEFVNGATGNTAPIRTISGAQTGLGTMGGIKIDTIGTIYVATLAGAAQTPTILAFSAAASGNATPAVTYTSSGWTIPDTALSLAVH